MFAACAARLFFHNQPKEFSELLKFEIKLQFFLLALKTSNHVITPKFKLELIVIRFFFFNLNT